MQDTKGIVKILSGNFLNHTSLLYLHQGVNRNGKYMLIISVYLRPGGVLCRAKNNKPCYCPHPKDGEGNVFTGVCPSTPGGVPQSQVLSQISGPRSFLGGTPVLAWLGGTPVPAVRTRLGYPTPPPPSEYLLRGRRYNFLGVVISSNPGG